MSGQTVYLITGANRGIGYGLAKTIAVRPNAVVFAAARDPTAQSLTSLAASHPNVHPVKFVAGDQTSNEAAVAEIQKTAGRLDVVIANAGISKYFGSIGTIPVSEFRDHWEVNTLGVIVLFQAVQHLLLASPTNAPIFALISTGAGSIAKFYNAAMGAPGASKAAANFIIKALDAENPKLVSLAIHPGWVATDMGNGGAKAFGMEQAPVTVEDSVNGVLSRIDGATKEKSSGKFFNFARSSGGNMWDIDTDEIPW
ncbi:aflatoxin biosynthesis ketoreductase-like protein nor-1 [Roridomyces roridus]|uniref:Aflatoxin biosynthesis ketoreductase-like protein nor-1 n=1 Tax=Roridomyces roridus TaxID=1738132 RepID=A0AAD7BNN8_9AGAR|nr:aflatoxin biosynthesis ketoreductase-like protein nor-1 [Roridomyces roridus]